MFSLGIWWSGSSLNRPRSDETYARGTRGGALRVFLGVGAVCVRDPEFSLDFVRVCPTADVFWA